MDTWVASTSWLLWIVLLWTCVCKYVLEILLSIFLYICPVVESLCHLVVLFLIFEKMLYHFTFSQQCTGPPLVIYHCGLIWGVGSSYPNECEEIFHWSFYLYFHNDYDVKYLLICLLAISVISLERYLFTPFAICKYDCVLLFSCGSLEICI